MPRQSGGRGGREKGAQGSNNHKVSKTSSAALRTEVKHRSLETVIESPHILTAAPTENTVVKKLETFEIIWTNEYPYGDASSNSARNVKILLRRESSIHKADAATGTDDGVVEVIKESIEDNGKYEWKAPVSCVFGSQDEDTMRSAHACVRQRLLATGTAAQVERAALGILHLLRF